MITVKNIAALGSSKAVSICYKNNQSISLHSSHEKRKVSPKTLDIHSENVIAEPTCQMHHALVALCRIARQHRLSFPCITLEINTKLLYWLNHYYNAISVSCS